MLMCQCLVHYPHSDITLVVKSMPSRGVFIITQLTLCFQLSPHFILPPSLLPSPHTGCTDLPPSFPLLISHTQAEVTSLPPLKHLFIQPLTHQLNRMTCISLYASTGSNIFEKQKHCIQRTAVLQTCQKMATFHTNTFYIHVRAHQSSSVFEIALQSAT